MPVMPGTSFVSQTHPRSAICPRPGSLIREESCGKVCVSLLGAPLSLQLFVRVGPRQQHRGAGDHCTSAWVCAWVGVGVEGSHTDIVKIERVKSWKQMPGGLWHTSSEGSCPFIFYMKPVICVLQLVGKAAPKRQKFFVFFLLDGKYLPFF